MKRTVSLSLLKTCTQRPAHDSMELPHNTVFLLFRTSYPFRVLACSRCCNRSTYNVTLSRGRYNSLVFLGCSAFCGSSMYTVPNESESILCFELSNTTPKLGKAQTAI